MQFETKHVHGVKTYRADYQHHSDAFTCRQQDPRTSLFFLQPSLSSILLKTVWLDISNIAIFVARIILGLG